MPHLLRMFVAPVLGVPEGRVTISSPDVGGAFGLKCTVFPEDVVIPAVAKLSGRPVKWIEDRWENLAAGVHSKDMICTMEIAAKADGTMTAFRGHFVTDSGAFSSIPFTPLVDSQCAGIYLTSCYDVRDVAYSVDNPLTNKCQIGAVRGVGWVPGQLAREVAIDQLARELGKDPVELRLQNMIGPDVYTTAFGQTYDGGSYAEALEKARDAVDYASFRERQAKAMEELVARHEREMDALLARRDEEVEDLAVGFVNEADALEKVFAERRARLVRRWEVAAEILRVEMERKRGVAFGRMEPVVWPAPEPEEGRGEEEKKDEQAEKVEGLADGADGADGADAVSQEEEDNAVGIAK